MIKFGFYYQNYPATPTPLPTVAPENVGMGLDLQGGISLWDGAPHVIQTWHSAQIVTTGFQAVLLVMLVIGAVMLIRRQLMILIVHMQGT